jgi:8-amino-7-oxononanoate synthase
VAQGQELRSQLWKNCQRVHEGLTSLGFKLGAAPSPVIASLMDGPEQAAAAWQVLLDAGVYVNLVVPPGAPKNLSLLRCSLSAAHTDEQVEQIIEGYAAVAQRLFDQPRAAASAYA